MEEIDVQVYYINEHEKEILNKARYKRSPLDFLGVSKVTMELE